MRQVVKQLEDIGKHAHGRDIGAGTWTLDDERRASIPRGREGNQIVAALGGDDWMRPREFLEGRLRASAFEHADIAQHVAAAAGARYPIGNLVVIPCEIGEKPVRKFSAT